MLDNDETLVPFGFTYIHSKRPWKIDGRVSRKQLPNVDQMFSRTLCNISSLAEWMTFRQLEMRWHYCDVIISATASQITSVSISLLNQLFNRRSKKTPKLRVTGLCEGNPPVTGGFPPQWASNADNFHLMTSSWGDGKNGTTTKM